MAVFLPGRFMGDRGVVIVQNAKVQGYAFLQEENGYQLSDILERMIPFAQADNLVPILRPALERKGVRVQFLPKRFAFKSLAFWRNGVPCPEHVEENQI